MKIFWEEEKLNKNGADLDRKDRFDDFAYVDW